MNILVIGLGFVGLTTGLGFAEKGHSVLGFEADPLKSAELAACKISLFEPGLSDALIRHIGRNFVVLSKLPNNIDDIQAVFICVGTPGSDDGSTDFSYVYGAIDMLESMLKSGFFGGIVVIKSTIPPDSTKTKIVPYLRKKGIAASIANNPEFLREGYCWDDFMNPDRIVCGVNDPEAANVLKAVYKDFNAPIIITSFNTAEFIKYLSNNMLANMISFSNEMSIIAEAIGDISIKQAFETLHMDRRWADSPMKHYVYPGCGFGGYCLPKDLQAMIMHSIRYGVNPVLLESVQAVNQSMASFFVNQIIADTKENIGVLGLSFKPKSDDVRSTPAADIISALQNKGYKSIYVFDPEANMAFKNNYSFLLHYCGNAEEVCEKAKTVIIVTAWPQFKGIDKRWPNVKFIDGRYML